MSTVVIGIGNRDRGDDAVGPVVVDRLAARAPAGARLATVRDDLLQLIELFAGAEKAVVVDAMRSGVAPGGILRLDASHARLPGALDGFGSTHTLNVGDAIELARTLGRLPPELIVYGVEVLDVTPGAGLSGAVAAALDELERLIQEECTCTKPR